MDPLRSWVVDFPSVGAVRSVQVRASRVQKLSPDAHGKGNLQALSPA